jgi:uncharacterized protein YecT (DUF1311 family)
VRSLLAALALALVAPCAHAVADTGADISQLRTCAVAAGVSDPGKLEACEKPIMAECGNDYAACYPRLMAGWDGLLNASFRDLTRGGVLERADARNLQSAQRAWIKFRDEDCDFYAGVWPGSRAPGQGAACRHRETRARAAVLTVRLEAARKLRTGGGASPSR